MSVALTAYLLALAIFIPASGRLADRFGARSVFRTAIICSCSAAGCGLAPRWRPWCGPLHAGAGRGDDDPGRAAGAAALGRQGDMVDAMSWLMAPAMIGPILGPPLGGLIVTWLDWRWIFYINLPMAVLAVWLVGRYIPISARM
jgi:MFS family permease